MENLILKMRPYGHFEFLNQCKFSCYQQLIYFVKPKVHFVLCGAEYYTFYGYFIVNSTLKSPFQLQQENIILTCSNGYSYWFTPNNLVI